MNTREQILETSWRVALPTQSVYTVMAAVFGWNAWRTDVPSLMIEYTIGLLACLWLIYCRVPILCRLREDDMIVTVAEESVRMEMLASMGRRRYLVVPYASVAGVAANWRQLYLRNRHGLHSIVPVAWHELTPEDRGRILHAVGAWRDRQRSETEQDTKKGDH